MFVMFKNKFCILCISIFLLMIFSCSNGKNSIIVTKTDNSLRNKMAYLDNGIIWTENLDNILVDNQENAEDDYESTWKRLEDPKFTSDMRYLTEKNTGKAIVGDITYMYNLGKLSSLSWRIDDTMISIFFTVSNIDEFPTESTDSILCCLLSASESISASAIKDINNVITESRK